MPLEHFAAVDFEALAEINFRLLDKLLEQRSALDQPEFSEIIAVELKQVETDHHDLGRSALELIQHNQKVGGASAAERQPHTASKIRKAAVTSRSARRECDPDTCSDKIYRAVILRRNYWSACLLPLHRGAVNLPEPLSQAFQYSRD